VKKLLLSLAAILVTASFAFAQSADEKAVADSVEFFGKALLSGKKAELDKCILPNASYGHSDGNIETAEEFIDFINDGKKDTYHKVSFKNQTIQIVGNFAIVRHVFDFNVTNKKVNNAQPYDLHLGVMQVWQKDSSPGTPWKLLARHACKLPN
jgi:hypothetical protein